MTDPNGWPDKPGVPLNPKQDGWHWVCAAVGISAPYPMLWSRDGKAWDTGDGWEFCTSPRMTERTRYLGVCLTPSEVAARVAEAREAGLREAAAEVDCGCDIRDAVLERLESQGSRRASYLCSRGDACCALAAAAIVARIKEKPHDPR